MFYVAVTTTGVYSRPSCPARLAKRENIRFFTTSEEAVLADFRPCGRCRPDRRTLAEQHAAAVAIACRLIETSEEVPSLEQLADAAGFSRFHFHRVFKSVMGVTPHDYVAAHRAQRVREELRQADTVTEAIYRSGFNSNSSFYADCTRTLGMSPASYRRGGSGTSIRYMVHERAGEAVLVAATDLGVCATLTGDDAPTLVRRLREHFPKARIVPGGRDLADVVGSSALGTVSSRTDLPDDLRRSALRLGLWQRLRVSGHAQAPDECIAS
jgi:AraC family transcriptional regulator of adaptative response/methylated-DNA-[protein]-cysteine methyltransferase